MIEFRGIIYNNLRFIAILSYNYFIIFLEFEQLRPDNISGHL
jgi:hypothetical protein